MPKRAECIAFANQKGGTGKTTACLGIAGHLAKNGCKVLVVDFDPQANATSGLGIDATTLKYSMHDVILNETGDYEGAPITEVILGTEIENLHLAPAELDLATVEIFMHQSKDNYSILDRILEGVRPFYDYILIDVTSNPSLAMINSLYASDRVIAPLDLSIFSVEALGNLQLYCHDLEKMTNHPLKQFTVVLNKYIKPNILSGLFGQPNQSQQIEAMLQASFQPIFIVPDAMEIYQSQLAGVPISHYAPNSKVSQAFAAIATMLSDCP